MATAAQPIVNSAALSASGQSALFGSERQLMGDDPVLPRQRRDTEYPEQNVRVEINLVSTAPNARPSSVLFGGLQDPSLEVVRPIPLDVSVEESNVIVHWRDIDEFGTGETLSCAIDDFSHTVRELYHYLHAEGIEVGADLLRVKHVLGQYIQPSTK